MDKPKRLDYVVVGGGLIGLTAALRLHDLGWTGIVLEQQSKLSESRSQLAPARALTEISPRVLALNTATQASLALAGLPLESLQTLGSPFRGMEVWDRELSGALNFDAQGWIVENHQLEGALLALAESKGIQIRKANTLRDSIIDDQRVWLDCGQGVQFEASLLIGADGAQSRVREILGVPMLNWAYHQRAVVAVVHSEKPHRGVTRQWFTGSGPLALLPLADPHGLVLIWSSVEGQALLEVSDSELESRLVRETDQMMGALKLVSKRQSFPLQQQHAMRYVKGRAVLLGDAAHTIHPLAGQGANLGFADVAELVDCLVQMSLDPSATIQGALSQFERRRAGQNILMTALTDGLSRLFTDPKPAWLRVARSWGMRLLDREAQIKRLLTETAAGRW
ncbi:MAG: FAD-dependent monooxygenase [Pseudomonadales bacterium]